MNDRECITAIRDMCNAQLGGQQPPAGGTVNAVSVKPEPFSDLGTGNQDPREIRVSPQQVVGVAFTVRAGTKGRNLRWFGSPGQFWQYNSWAIFDSGGSRVFYADNAAVVGTLGTALDDTPLAQLGPGSYTLGVAVNASGNLAFQFVQG